MSASSPISHAVVSSQETLSGPFKVTAATETDIWRKPPSHDVLNAPINYTHIADTTTLSSATATFYLDSKTWTKLYDQAGIFLYFPATKAWIKAGVEITDDRHTRFLSTVVTLGDASDWSIYPCPPITRFEEIVNSERKIEVRASADKTGGLKIEVKVQGGEWLVIREITGVFAGNQELEKEGVWVGGYAARPSKEGGDLEVRFDGLKFESK
ncbi:hypothetical protein BJ508DRAFT_366960 [Ascobolus immersus RN42]|uniref:Concanavalin A-like lectin/glucanase n=1 Tax=Ascobolus immersus RN42 TaxID=1160509 RepID=A0A3N4HFI6_ASCIM|nr:hypothetical protein BJ508DRAFT_366960 [Ascobolus immersus RN42]